MRLPAHILKFDLQGVGTCDHTRLERVANLATSFLYIGLGIKTMQYVLNPTRTFTVMAAALPSNP